ALAADLVALAIGQNVRRLLTERVDAHRPALRESHELGELQLGHPEVFAARIVDDVERIEGAAEGIQSVPHLQADQVLAPRAPPARATQVLARGAPAAGDASADLDNSQLLGPQARVIARDLEIVPVEARGP